MAGKCDERFIAQLVHLSESTQRGYRPDRSKRRCSADRCLLIPRTNDTSERSAKSPENVTTSPWPAASYTHHTVTVAYKTTSQSRQSQSTCCSTKATSITASRRHLNKCALTLQCDVIVVIVAMQCSISVQSLSPTSICHAHLNHTGDSNTPYLHKLKRSEVQCCRLNMNA